MEKLGISDRLLHLGFQALHRLGFKVSFQNRAFKISNIDVEPNVTDTQCLQTIEQFIAAVKEEQFQRQYFCTVPLATISAIVAQEVVEEI